MSTVKQPALNHNVKVDDDVWGALQTMARPFIDGTPNDVLRRVLLKTAEDGPIIVPPQPLSRRPGALAKAVERGDLKAGDVLVCEQTRRKRTFKATVTSDGWIALLSPEEGEFDKPSPALAHCTGGQINGWGFWTHERSGKRLQEYRH